MRQISLNLSKGEVNLEEIPSPRVRPGYLLIQTEKTLISLGTERMLVEFGQASALGKIRQQPEKVKEVLQKIKTDGLITTIQAVDAKLSQPMALGYCNVGRVIQIGEGIESFRVGDRVISNGPHAEIVSVPKHLCAKVPDSLSSDQAVFTVISAVALQGIRLAQPTLGERFVVIGLGLLGLLAVQILRANGCRVLGIDLDAEKCELAKSFGAEIIQVSEASDIVAAAMNFSRGDGVDGVLIAAATKSQDPIRQAALMSRKRGRIILLGSTGLDLDRSLFYEKELSFQVSCSYGPGRYDKQYEEDGIDYPLGFVRWTAQRNFAAVLGLMDEGKLNVEPLISARTSLDHIDSTYEELEKGSPLGIVIEYPIEAIKPETLSRKLLISPRLKSDSRIHIGIIGAGIFTGTVLAKVLKSKRAHLKTIVSNGGFSGTSIAKKYGFEISSTSSEDVLQDPEINIVFITTRHDSHAGLTVKALESGKNVYVEKPLAISLEQLAAIEKVYQHPQKPMLMVGFNRRFSPHVQKLYGWLQSRKMPRSIHMTINAGALPSTHWHLDLKSGGGRIVGEGCHFIDLARYLAGSEIQNLKMKFLAGSKNSGTIVLDFVDGSQAHIHYLDNGSKLFPKERIEVFCGGMVGVIDNFKSTKGFGTGAFSGLTTWGQDKGHRAAMLTFLEAVEKGNECPIPLAELIEVSRWSIDAQMQI